MAFEHIYRPQHKSDQEIVNDFVVRNAVFERIMADIRKDGPKKLSQHHIVQGLRGMGKSTLFERIRVEMKQAELAKQWLTVKTAEENWPVNSLLDFWIWIGQHMAAVDPAGFGAVGDLGALWTKDDQHEQCFTTIEARLKGAQKKLLMLVDNVGDLFRKFSKHENHALRELLISSKHIKLIGGTAVRLDELETHDAPYFDLFKEHHLAGLNKTEVTALLSHYAIKNGNPQVEQVVKNDPHRVDHLRVLTGGVPRTIMLLLDVFDKDGDATVFDDLRRTLDLVTPLYKHRMDELSAQKQKIVHALAMQWDGMSTGEVAAATRLESKVVSAQLGQLVREGFVLRDETSTKNHFYQLAERFFNIWYLMNNAQRNGAAKVRWLTRFFELWCDERGLKERAKKHMDSIGREGLNPADLILITNALLGSPHLDRSTKELVYERSMRSYPDHTDQLLHSSQWPEHGASAKGWRETAGEAIERLDLERAERILDAEADMSEPWAMIYRGDIAVLRGELLKTRKAYEDGLAISQKLAQEDPHNAQAQRDLSISYERLGDLLLQEGKGAEARKAYEDGFAIRQKLAQEDPHNAQAQRDLSVSYNKLGDLLLQEGKGAEARKAYEDGFAIRQKLAHEDPHNAQAQRDLSVSYTKLGDLLLREGKGVEAREAYEDGLAISRKLAEADPHNAQAQRDLSVSYTKLGDLLLREGKGVEARKAFEDGLRIRKTLAEKDPTNARAQRDLALAQWALFRIGELVDPEAESHLVAYVSIVDAMADKAIAAWKEGDLGNALSMTAQLCGAPLYTGGALNALLWGIAREQYHGIRQLFEERFTRLKEHLRPVYFALLKLMKDEDPDSHRRMGKELEEPVREILARVDEMRKELGKPAIGKTSSTRSKAPRKSVAKKKRAK